MDAETRRLECQDFKQEVIDKFLPTASYSGKQIAFIINGLSLKSMYQPPKPSEIKKGDVLSVKTASKVRPAVVIRVLKDRTVIYVHLTSTENIHCMTSGKSRCFGEGCLTYGFSICSEDFAIENYIGIYDDMKAVNQSIKDLKEFFAKNI